MQSCALRTAAFSRAGVRPASVSRSSLTVKAAQDLKGMVVGTKMEKTVVVEVERLQTDATYMKRKKVTKRYIVHDEQGVAGLGDYVKVSGIPPISKTKRFAVSEVLRRAD